MIGDPSPKYNQVFHVLGFVPPSLSLWLDSGLELSRQGLESPVMMAVATNPEPGPPHQASRAVGQHRDRDRNLITPDNRRQVTLSK